MIERREGHSAVIHNSGMKLNRQNNFPSAYQVFPFRTHTRTLSSKNAPEEIFNTSTQAAKVSRKRLESITYFELWLGFPDSHNLPLGLRTAE